MKLRFLLINIALLMVAVSCRRSDIRTVTIKVPGMNNAACAAIVVKALEATPGIQPGNAIKVDIAARTVTASYESLITALKNLEFAIADAGFAANEVPANAAAASKLPPECKGTGPVIMLPAGK